MGLKEFHDELLKMLPEYGRSKELFRSRDNNVVVTSNGTTGAISLDVYNPSYNVEESVVILVIDRRLLE